MIPPPTAIKTAVDCQLPTEIEPEQREHVEQLQPQQQATLLRTIDTFLKAAEK